MICDLFAGPGGWDEGLRSLDHEDVVGVELDADACATAEAAGHRREHADVAALDPHQYADVDGLVASPPCQPFSSNGRRGGLADPRGQLVYEPLRWIDALRPRWVALEQVRAVLPIWRDYVATLRTWGYSAWCTVLDAADFGVPQHRLRAVLVARRDGPFADLPEETHGRLRHVSQGAALGWLNPAAWRVNTGMDWKKGQPREAAQTIPGNRPAATVTTRSVGQWRIYPPDGAPYRGLTEAEASVLQTFPADYPWQGRTALSRGTQIGNAVPPQLAARIVQPFLTPVPVN